MHSKQKWYSSNEKGYPYFLSQEDIIIELRASPKEVMQPISDEFKQLLWWWGAMKRDFANLSIFDKIDMYNPDYHCFWQNKESNVHLKIKLSS